MFFLRKNTKSSLLKINIETNLDKIIGEGVEKYVKDWFEKIYNLPVKTILF